MSAQPDSLEARAILESQIAALEKTDPNASAHRFHITRYLETLSFLPNIEADVLDLGGALGIFTGLLSRFRPYRLTAGDGFDFDRDPFPYADAKFDIVLFMEVLEHLREDPMHAMFEINRITKPGGMLLLTTPNIASWKAIHRALSHENPALFAPYLRHGGTDRHNREYTFMEVIQLVKDAGFQVLRAEAMDIYEHLPQPPAIPGFDTTNRGDTTFCLARKAGPGSERRPRWLYWP